MTCCGQRRSQLSMNGQAVSLARKAVAMGSPVLLFEYTGKTAMTVVGSGTGQAYRFSAPGARVQVDARDVQSMAGVPNLVRVRMM